MRWIVITLAVIGLLAVTVSAARAEKCSNECAAIAKNFIDKCFKDDRTPEICLENTSKFLGESVVDTAKVITKKLSKYQSDFIRSQHGWFDYNVGRCLTFAGLKRKSDPEFKRSFTTEQTATNAERAIYSMCMIKATILRGGELQKMLETSF